MPTEIAVSLISSVVGGLLVAVLNHLFTRRKTEAEVEKLRAEAGRIKAETEKVRAETGKFSAEFEEVTASITEATYYTTLAANERIIYDGTSGIEGYDIEVVRESRKFGHAFKNGTLIILRASNRGVYQLQLCKYIFNGNESEFIPKNELLAGKRKLRITFEARVTRGSRTLIFAFIALPRNSLLDKREVTIEQASWMRTDLYFRVPPHEDCLLQIVDLYGSQPGSLLLRNLVLAERSA